MRRIAVSLLGAACLLVGWTGPAGAAPSGESNTGSSVNVFWTTREPIGPNTFRLTTWYIGVYSDSEYGISSDAYQSVSACVYFDSRHYRCRQQSYRVGFSDLNKPGESYVIDDQNLEYATIRGLYPLESYDEYGNPAGPAEWTRVTADVTGVGDIGTSKSTRTGRRGGCWYRTTTESAGRGMVATGTVNGADLGSTNEGGMSTYTSRTVYHSC
ncbi:MAG: hypothetical protein ABR518_02580 [Actinomycetota bacterium]